MTKRNEWKFATAALTLAGAIGCGAGTPGNTPTDAAPEASDDATLTPDAGDAPRVDGAPDSTGMSRAGQACADDTACGGAPLECDEGLRGGFCTAMCTHNASQDREIAQCGGRGSTCLSYTNGMGMRVGSCAATCNPNARAGMPGTCRPGTACTGWWFTHEDYEPDRVGCDYFCGVDEHCPMGERCNVRLGECGSVANLSLRPDGDPCDPTMDPDTGVSRQCKGICFQATDNRREGVCGSYINLGVTANCPDNPMLLRPYAPSDENGRLDNIAECIYRECTTNADCTAPHRCVPQPDGDPSICTFPEAATDGGVPDATSADAGATDASADRAGG